MAITPEGEPVAVPLTQCSIWIEMAKPVRNVAVIDIGKTNAKLALVSAEDGAELALKTAANPPRSDGPYQHFDVPKLWDFICGALAEIRRESPIDAVSITAHGSGGALITGDPDGDGLALPILDYEDPGPDELAADYDAIRPPFAETLSPRLPAGLNLGAQIFWQERRFPKEFGTARHYVNYPQYWGWRLTGVAATEMTSMGAHTDLWAPMQGTWSSLAKRAGWQELLAPLRSAFEAIGPVHPELARRIGLDPGTPVHCGIHDSNASLLPHLMQREAPFTVVSTGTWVIIFAVGGSFEKLDPRRDTLANVSAFGDPVPCARFMGGREFERLVGGVPAEAGPADLDRVLAERIMALPTFVPGVGPFPQAEGRWTHAPEKLTLGERMVAASLYEALVTAESMAIAGAAGPVIVEGPFGKNHMFCSALAAIRGTSVAPSGGRTGTTLGAALLGGGSPARRPLEFTPVEPLRHSAFVAYAAEWREAARREARFIVHSGT
jgi:sugar (pentulose or hexulose) kinase